MRSFGLEVARELDLPGASAVVVDEPSLIEVRGHTFEYVGPKVFIVLDGLCYVVAARFSKERASAVEPIANRLVESLRISTG